MTPDLYARWNRFPSECARRISCLGMLHRSLPEPIDSWKLVSSRHMGHAAAPFPEIRDLALTIPPDSGGQLRLEPL